MKFGGPYRIVGIKLGFSRQINTFPTELSRQPLISIFVGFFFFGTLRGAKRVAPSYEEWARDPPKLKSFLLFLPNELILFLFACKNRVWTYIDQVLRKSVELLLITPFSSLCHLQEVSEARGNACLLWPSGPERILGT